MPDGSATAHLYFPKLATVLTEGYGFGSFRKDMFAGLTVAIVALPLSMAIAVASGVAPPGSGRLVASARPSLGSTTLVSSATNRSSVAVRGSGTACSFVRAWSMSSASALA